MEESRTRRKEEVYRRMVEFGVEFTKEGKVKGCAQDETGGLDWVKMALKCFIRRILRSRKLLANCWTTTV